MCIQMEKEWDYKILLEVAALKAATSFFCYT